MKKFLSMLMILACLIVAGCRENSDAPLPPVLKDIDAPETVDIKKPLTITLKVEDSLQDAFAEVELDDSEFGKGITYSASSFSHPAIANSGLNPLTGLYEYSIDLLIPGSLKGGTRTIIIRTIRFLREDEPLEAVYLFNICTFTVNDMFTITYHNDNGPAIPVVSYQYGERIILPQNPVCEGMLFEGWLDNATGEKFTETTMPDHNLVLRADWNTPKDDTFNKLQFDGLGMNIDIKVYPKAEYDPFDPNYTGDFQAEKQELIHEIEDAYNVDIRYVDYTGTEPWGPARIQAIKNGYLTGNRIGDIYLISSDWIPNLAASQALASLYDTQTNSGYFSEFGFTPSPIYRDLATYQKKVYGYTTGVARPDYFMYYNASLVRSAGLDDPAQMWMDHEWNWSNFQDFLDQAEASTVFANDSTCVQISGQPTEYTLGFLSAQGGKFVHPATNSLLWGSEDSMGIINYLREIAAKGYIDKDTNDISDNFKAGKAIFATGGLWFLGNDQRFSYSLPFEIGAVPYPVQDGDETTLSYYSIPAYTTNLFAVANVTSGLNGLNSEVLFNILDDLNRGRVFNYDELTPDQEYKMWLETKFDSMVYVDAIMSVQDPKYLYFEKAFLVSTTVGGGSNYGPNALYPLLNKIICKPTADPVTELEYVRPFYEAVLDNWR